MIAITSDTKSKDIIIASDLLDNEKVIRICLEDDKDEEHCFYLNRLDMEDFIDALKFVGRKI